MRDFTFNAYRLYIKAIQSAYHPIMRVVDYLRFEVKPDSFAIIRHDVDRRPLKALRMAQLEYELGIRSTYYFRTKALVFKPWVIRAVKRLGHEIGYHYETLSDTRGDHIAAMKQFIRHLNRIRKYSPVDTVSMHGRPLSSQNNLDLWRNPEIRSMLANKCKLIGEVYLDIDYHDIAYICDTGRNWDTQRSNKRDNVESEIPVRIKNGMELLNALSDKRWEKIFFQIHPERWSENTVEYIVQYIADSGVNLIKKMV